MKPQSTPATAARRPGRSGDGPLPARSLDVRGERGRLEREAQRAALAPSPGPLSAARRRGDGDAAVVAGIGRPLAAPLQRLFERRLGVALGEVRIHAGEAAARQADERAARAFTVGSDVVLGREAVAGGVVDAQVLAHELAHVAQQHMPGGGEAVQRDGRPGTGVGRSPPSEAFTTIEGIGAEDDHVLFRRDGAELDEADRTSIDALVGRRSEPVTVHVHGYASQEGDDEYNLNLSAHRAVAVMRYVRTLLPEGSRVVAYAHGETSEFGGQRANRRVGIDVLERLSPSFLEGGAVLPGLGVFPRFPLSPPGSILPDLRLEAPLPFGTGPLRPAGEEELRIFRPLPPLSLPVFDSGGLAPLYSARGLPYTAADARSYEEHFVLWRDRYVAWGLAPDQAAWLAQLGTEKAASTQLSLEYPTRSEELDRMLRTEPTVIPLLNDSMMRWLFEQMR